MNGVLTLNLDGKCGEKNDSQCICPGGSGISGLKAKKEPTTDGVTNFTKLTHYIEGKTFNLSGKLQDGGEIGTRGKNINNVTEVSVYYWNGNDKVPILLEITKGGDTPEYYSYWGSTGGGLGNWRNRDTSGKSLKHLLDEKNCQRNGAVPFNIQDSTSGSILNDSKSSCINKYRSITESGSKLQPPPGSNYDVREYTISGGSARISRVTLRGQPVTFSTPSEAIHKIRLYSYPGSDKVPLLIEFLKQGGAGSEWYESQNSNGNNWGEVGNGNTFYVKDKSTPQPVLSEKLDELLCKQYDNVTLDLTYEKYRNGSKYCCSDHQKKDGRISVADGHIKVNNNHMAKYYKHEVTNGYSLGGIYYKDGDQRKRITAHGLFFPTSVNSVYAFYCKGDGPSLIYVDSENPAARGWYKNSNGQWTWNSRLSGIKSTSIDSELTCAKWIRLKKVLEECNCSGLKDCSDPKQLAEEELLQKEAEKAETERKRAIAAKAQRLQQKQFPTDFTLYSGIGNPCNSTDYGSSSGGGSGSSSVNSSSSSSQQGTSHGSKESAGHIGPSGESGKTVVDGEGSVASGPGGAKVDPVEKLLKEAVKSAGNVVGSVLYGSAIAGLYTTKATLGLAKDVIKSTAASVGKTEQLEKQKLESSPPGPLRSYPVNVPQAGDAPYGVAGIPGSVTPILTGNHDHIQSTLTTPTGVKALVINTGENERFGLLAPGPKPHPPPPGDLKDSHYLQKPQVNDILPGVPGQRPPSAPDSPFLPPGSLPVGPLGPSVPGRSAGISGELAANRDDEKTLTKEQSTISSPQATNTPQESSEAPQSGGAEGQGPGTETSQGLTGNEGPVKSSSPTSSTATTPGTYSDIVSDKEEQGATAGNTDGDGPGAHALPPTTADSAARVDSGRQAILPQVPETPTPEGQPESPKFAAPQQSPGDGAEGPTALQENTASGNHEALVEAPLTVGLSSWAIFGASSGTLTGFGWWLYRHARHS